MITVKLYGLLRLDSGLKTVQLEAETIKQLFAELEKRSFGSLKARDLRNCVIMINGKAGSIRAKLSDGDEVMLLSPVAGG